MAEMSRLVDARREEKYKFFQEELQKRSRVRKDKTGQKGSSLTPKEETPKDFKLQNE